MDIGVIDRTLSDKPVGHSIRQPVRQRDYQSSWWPSARSQLRYSELGMAKAKENVVFLGDKEIKVADLTDEQKYFHSQVIDLTNQKARITFQLDQVNASLKVFEDAFVKSTRAKAEEVLATDNG